MYCPCVFFFSYPPHLSIQGCQAWYEGVEERGRDIGAMLHRRLLHPESKSPSVSVQQLQKNKKSKTKTKKQASLPASLFVGLFCHVIDLFCHMMGLFCLGVVPFHFRETRPCSLYVIAAEKMQKTNCKNASKKKMQMRPCSLVCHCFRN